jgi:hypothetical protein
VSDNDAAAVAAIYLVFGLVSLVVFLGVSAFLCWLLSGWLGKIPPEHRKQEPGKVWLLMIPLFHIYWVWQVFPPMALSFDSFFRSRNETVDSSLGLAKMLCWAVLAGLVGFVPCLGMILGPLVGLAQIVLLVMVLVKFNALKDRVVGGGASPAAPAAPAA